MAKPDDLYEWATEDGATLEPEEGEKAKGFSPGDKPPAGWINHLWNGSYRWNKYVDNLHDEPEFLNKVYDWKNTHIFNGGITRFYTSIQLWFNGQVDYEPKRPSRKLVPVSSLVLGLGYEYAWSPVDLDLPWGAVITRARGVLSQLNNANSRGMAIRVARVVPDRTVPYANNTTIPIAGSEVSSSLSAGDELVETPEFAETVDNALAYYQIQVRASDTSTLVNGQLPEPPAVGIPDKVRWLEVEFLDPGPRSI